MKDSEPIVISVVVPVYNEEGNLPVLVPKLMEVLEGLGCSCEMIFVDDGSSDGSLRILRDMASQYPSLRVLRFRENRGLSTALVAGMREARGKKSSPWIQTFRMILPTFPSCWNTWIAMIWPQGGGRKGKIHGLRKSLLKLVTPFGTG